MKAPEHRLDAESVPKPTTEDMEAEWLLVHNFPPHSLPPEMVLPRGTQVRILGLKPSGAMIEFEVPGKPERYETHYGWMFAKKTPDNVTRLHEYWQKKDAHGLAESTLKKQSKLVEKFKAPWSDK